MGNVFSAKRQYENALAMYEKVVEIWYSALTAAITTVETTNIEEIGKPNEITALPSRRSSHSRVPPDVAKDRKCTRN